MSVTFTAYPDEPIFIMTFIHDGSYDEDAAASRRWVQEQMATTPFEELWVISDISDESVTFSTLMQSMADGLNRETVEEMRETYAKPTYTILVGRPEITAVLAAASDQEQYGNAEVHGVFNSIDEAVAHIRQQIA